MARTKRTVRVILEALEARPQSEQAASSPSLSYDSASSSASQTPTPPPPMDLEFSEDNDNNETHGRPQRRCKRPARLACYIDPPPPDPADDLDDDNDKPGQRVKRANSEANPYAPQQLGITRHQVLTLNSSQMDQLIERQLAKFRGRTPSPEVRAEIARIRRLVSNREASAQSRERRNAEYRQMVQRIRELEEENARMREYYELFGPM